MARDAVRAFCVDRAPKLAGVGEGLVSTGPVFVAVEFATGGNDQYEIVTSPDGITWIPRKVGADVNSIVDLCRGADSWVAVSDYGSTSTHSLSRSVYDGGVVWVRQTSPVALGTAVYPAGITYGGGTYVFSGVDGGAAPKFLYSTDEGKNWTEVDASATVPPMVAYGNSTFVAVGADLPSSSGGGIIDGGTTATLMTSADGITWSAESTPASLQNYTFGGGPTSAGNWLAFRYLSDGKFWLAGFKPLDPFTPANGHTSDSLILAHSTDGSTWTQIDTGLPYWPWDIAYDGAGHYVVVLGNGRASRNVHNGVGKCLVSSDGLSWSIVSTMPTETEWFSVDYGAGVFVAVGRDNYNGVSYPNNTIAYSSDYGATWTAATNPLGPPDYAYGDSLQDFLCVRFG